MRRVRAAGAAALLLAAILGFFFPNPHPHFWWNAVPGFDLFFGFAGALLLAGLAKALGRLGLQRKEGPHD